jgi:RNA polymerase sigma-70 factor (ECF subfamily)
MLTVRRRPEEWLRGFSSGANDYLSKPLDPSELIERVQNCLAGKAQQFSNPGTPEYHLIQAAIAGNRAAFEVLIQKYKVRLIESIRPSARNIDEAEDIVAHAFMMAFEKMDQFRGEASFFTWLYRIAMNQAFEARRKSSAISLETITQGDETALPAALTKKDRVQEDLADQGEAARVLQVLHRVPEPYRQILQLYFLKDMPYESIARTLKVPLGTVMSRLYVGRQFLKDIWAKMEAPI